MNIVQEVTFLINTSMEKVREIIIKVLQPSIAASLIAGSVVFPSVSLLTGFSVDLVI